MMVLHLEGRDSMAGKGKKRRTYADGKGLAGHYVLNQKFQRFEDRRTKRLRTRGARNSQEIALAS